MLTQERLSAIDEYVSKNEKGLLKFLETIVNINSPTGDKGSVDKVTSKVRDKLETNGIKTKTHIHSQAGDLLVTRSKKSIVDTSVVLSSHVDIVVGPAIHTNYREKNDKIYGTGTQDLKGGTAVLVYTLKFLAENDLLQNVTACFTPDEETGSVAHKKALFDIYKSHDYGMVYEAANTKKGSKNYGNYIGLVTGRKGSLNMKIETFGVNAHSGIAMTKKERISAVSELIHKLEQIDRLDDFEKGVTVNVGMIEGGISANTIAPYAEAFLNMRAWRDDDLKEVEQKIKKIASGVYIKGTKTKCHSLAMSPAMEASEKSKKLFELAKGIGKSFGLTVDEIKRGGASDASYMNKLGIPVIDGFGPPGWGSHDPNSYIYKKGLFDALKLSIGTVLAIRDLG